jgi:Zinc finger, C3HC4 type (RING finger)
MKPGDSRSETAPPHFLACIIIIMEQQRIRIPGTFVVFQGVSGDGLCNTIDYIERLLYTDDGDACSSEDARSQRLHQTNVNDALQSSSETEHMMIVTPPSSPPSSSAALSDGPRSTNENPPDTLHAPSSVDAMDESAVEPSITHPVTQSTPNLDSLGEEQTSMHPLIDSNGKFPNRHDSSQEMPAAAIEPMRQDESKVPALGSGASEEEQTNLTSFQLEEWRSECREQELFHRREWYEGTHSTLTAESEFVRRILDPSNSVTFDTATSSFLEPWWMTPNGCLAIFKALPMATRPPVLHDTLRLPRGAPCVSVIGSLAPGTVVMATELITVRSDDWVTPVSVKPTELWAEEWDQSIEEIRSTVQIYPPGRLGWIQILKLESPMPGYCVLSVDGYSFLGPGLPHHYIPGGMNLTNTSGEVQLEQRNVDDDHHYWYWRVKCLEGAFVRDGIDLTAKHVATIPYGSLVRVLRKTVNAMALSRLQIEAILYHEHDEDHGFYPQYITGWISEFLNPLSGQRGPIVLPLPFPSPALFQVTLSNGAVIRSDIELSSPVIGHAPCDAVLSVTGCVYTEQPKDKCVVRYRLAGNGGYVSVRLNLNPPEDRRVAQYVGMDTSFHPDQPGLFHVASIQRVPPPTDLRMPAAGHSTTISPVSTSLSSGLDDDSATADATSPYTPHCQYTSSPVPRGRRHTRHASIAEDVCVICLCESRTATMIHGDTGHICCCLICARILQARGDVCPVCRLPIERVIQHFWA